VQTFGIVALGAGFVCLLAVVPAFASLTLAILAAIAWCISLESLQDGPDDSDPRDGRPGGSNAGPGLSVHVGATSAEGAKSAVR
jgi:hypothetical protein